MTKEQEERAKQLAKEHWEYLCKLLETHGVSADMISIIGFHYKTAFIHGYKHSVDDCKQKITFKIDVNEIEKDIDKLMNGKVGGNE